MEDNKRPFKITTNHIGDFIVMKMKPVRKIAFNGFPLIVEAQAGSYDIHEVYAVLQIRFHNEGVRDVSYKVNLRPVGMYRSFIGDRNWYTCDVEHHIENNDDFKCFDDAVDALNYAEEMNGKIYPTKRIPLRERIKHIFFKRHE